MDQARATRNRCFKATYYSICTYMCNVRIYQIRILINNKFDFKYCIIIECTGGSVMYGTHATFLSPLSFLPWQVAFHTFMNHYYLESRNKSTQMCGLMITGVRL